MPTSEQLGAALAAKALILALEHKDYRYQCARVRRGLRELFNKNTRKRRCD